MAWRRASTTALLPSDPAGEAVAASIAEMVQGATVELLYSPLDSPEPSPPHATATATATASGVGPAGWRITCTVRLSKPRGAIATPERDRLRALLNALPAGGLRAASQFRAIAGDAATNPLRPAMKRALRDTLAVEVLADRQTMGDGAPATELIAETIDYLIELSSTRVESQRLTHGVVIADVFTDAPRLQFDYPADVAAAKRAPLLFDGQRSLLLVDTAGHPRFEVQRHRLDALRPGVAPRTVDDFVESGSFVAEATRRLGGLGFFLRSDQSIWTFVGGQPLVVRRHEHWTAFPLELTALIEGLIEGGAAAGLVVQTAYILSVQGRGAILAIVGDRDTLDHIVAPKDRYDLRDRFDPPDIPPETLLHHLIDAQHLDQQTLARLAGLDGATIVDHAGNLLAYGAIVTSSDSQHEGARTAAAKTLSYSADVVLMVSQDGDITVFHAGEVAFTFLGRRTET